ncbi:MAG TPA: WYL domain-containing protein, partial [Ruminococcus sp.]|nr:WYL domain-containing protein [Ruminococcus sp.]
MELFSEIYSAYYNAVTEILSEQNLSKKDIISIINRNAFSESSLYIVPAICGEWELLSENNGIYNSKLKNTPSMPLTETEKQWLKAVISDSRSSLFIDDDTKLHISEMLKNTEPLFNQEDFL